MLALFFAPGSSSMAPHIALREAGAAFDLRLVSFARRENRSAEFLAINPEGKVPVLLIGGRPITEVAAILFHVARRFPGADLLPAGPEAEVEALSWLSFCAATLHPARRAGPERAAAVYRIADRRLAGREWVLGRYSIADIHLFRLFWRLSASLPPVAATCPSLMAHHDRMLKRPAVAETIRIEAAIGYELPP